jgi:hypothetical protein
MLAFASFDARFQSLVRWSRRQDPADFLLSPNAIEAKAAGWRELFCEAIRADLERVRELRSWKVTPRGDRDALFGE